MALTSYASVAVLSGGAGAKGSYTEVVASTPYNSSRLHLVLLAESTNNLFFLLDIATGAAGAETIVVANISVMAGTPSMVGQVVALDVDIPVSTRLAVRCQSVSASATLALSIILEDRALASLTAPVTYGTVSGFSSGTSIDPGSTVSTKGAYVEMTASTTARLDAVALCFTIVAQSQPIAAYQTWLVDLATGASGAETIVIGDLRIDLSQTSDMIYPSIVRLPISISAGTRLAVRCSCTVNTATQRNLRVTVIGMQEPAAGAAGGGEHAHTFIGGAI